MSGNMPVLWRNALMQFETEIARKAWVWFAETRGIGAQYEADRYAREVDQIVKDFGPILRAANRAYSAPDEVLGDVLRFILTRHANIHFGGNVKPPFLQSAD